MKISDDGIALIKEFEGCRLQAYPDPGTGGVPWTVGYGHTGPEVMAGYEVTQEAAEALLREDLALFEGCVEDVVEVELQQHQFDALVAFSFNVGCAAFAASTLLKLLNAGNVEGAQAQFARWDKAGGRVLAGLTRRRLAEAGMFGDKGIA